MRVQDVIVESSEITQLRESTHKELYRQLLLLEKSFNQPMKIGNAYIPVPVYVIQDHVDTFNKSYETPNGEFCTLLKINADTLEFKNKAGKVVEWPKQKRVGVSYMTTLIATDVTDYNKIRTMMSLIFNLTLAASSEE